MATAFNRSIAYIAQKDRLALIKNELAQSSNNSSKTLNQLLLGEYPDAQAKTSTGVLKNVIQSIFSTSKTASTLIKGFPPLKKVVEILLPNVATKRKYYGELRQFLLKSNGGNFETTDKIYDLTFRKLSITREEANALSQNYQSKVFERNSNKTIYFQEDLIELIHLLKDGDEIDKVLCLQLTCGLRFIEALRTATFTIPETGVYGIESVRMDGLVKAKAKNARTWTINPIIELSADKVVEMAEEIREYLKKSKRFDLPKSKLTSIFLKRANERLRAHMHITSHELRRIYAVFSYGLFANKTSTSLSVWISNHLGHAIDNLTSSASYSNVSILSKSGEPVVDGVDGKVIGLTKRIERVEERVEGVEEQVAGRVSSPTRGNNKVELMGLDGEYHMVLKNMKLRDNKTLERGLLKVAELDRLNIPVNNKNLRLLGFGGSIVGKLIATRD